MSYQRIYTPTARFDTGRALTEDELRKLAPSVFATAAHESRSARFAPIPTIDVIRGLSREGFDVVGARQSGSRDVTRRDFTKHMLRIRKRDMTAKVGDTVLELYLKNANDGTSCYELMAGMFRVQCLNSLVAQDSTIDEVKVKHTGDVIGDVIDGTYRVLGSAQGLLEAPREWGAIALPREAKEVFAAEAWAYRFGEPEEGELMQDVTPIKPAQLLQPRRLDDRGDDLWRVFNVVQENAIRGGLTAMGRDANNRPRRTTTREIKGIDQDVRLNRALWRMTERMAQIMRSAS